MKRTCLVLYGGPSSEHEVSRISAASVVHHLLAGSRTEILPVSITRDGRWFVQDAQIQAKRAADGLPLSTDPVGNTQVHVVPGEGLMNSEGPLTVDCAFPVLHGPYGEDGTVQALLEVAGIPYVGADILGSAVGMRKTFAKRLWLQQDLPVLPFREIALQAWETGDHGQMCAEVISELGLPLFVKPDAAGSSVAVTKVKEPGELAGAVDLALQHDRIALIEPGLNVREIETSVLGNEEARSFPPGEVIPSHEFYDYEAKYIDPNGAELVIPADLPEPVQHEIQRVCTQAFHACGAQGLARVDCFV